MEIQKKVLRVKMDEFTQYLDKQMLYKFDDGLRGLKDRFQTLMTIFKDIMTYTADISLCLIPPC